jgi:hypothetical protein
MIVDVAHDVLVVVVVVVVTLSSRWKGLDRRGDDTEKPWTRLRED